MTLRVAVDATAIPGRRVGVGAYVTELLRAMDPLDVDIHVFVNRRDESEFASLTPNATLHPVRLPNRPARLLWADTVLPARLRRLGPDVVHGPHYTLPTGLRAAGVVTFHDPTFFTLPELHERSKVAYFTRAARRGIDRAARVIAVSEYASRGAVEHGGGAPERVDVVPEGVDLNRYRPPVGSHRTSSGDAFVLFVGTLEPRKDVPTLIAAHADLVKAGLPHRLVLCGPAGWGAASIEEALARSNTGAVDRTGYVSEEQKIALYQGASLVVYPSIAEGFGLPVLEAMACGTPVVTTTGSAPEEMAGDAALLVPPRDPTALREAMARVLQDRELAAELGRRGHQRAQAFSWTKTAERTVEVYRKTAGGSD